MTHGEQQLICLCRGILRRNKIVILEENPADMDEATEQKIKHLIKCHFSAATMITITNRVNTISESDRVMLVSNGKILEYDKPSVLMQNPTSELAKLLREL